MHTSLGLDTANKTDPQYQVDPVWKPYYSARESYNSYLDPPHPADAPLNATFWHRVTEVFERNEYVPASFVKRGHVLTLRCE